MKSLDLLKRKKSTGSTRLGVLCRAVAMVPQYLKTAGDKYCNTTKIYSRKIPGIIFKVGHAFPCMSRACNHGQQRSHQHTKLEGS